MRQPIRCLAAVIFIAALAGCTSPEPESELDKFGERTEDDRTIPDMGTPEGGQQVDFSGTYLLAIATRISPESPLLFETEVVVDENFVVDFTFQPLKTDEVGGMPREDARTPVGDALVVEDVQLEEDGTFVADMGTLNVPGDANPISGGDIVATVVLEGNVLGTDSFCGGAQGQVTQPTMLDLNGSTFGTVAVEADADLTMIEPILQCPAAANNGTDAGMDAGGGDMGGDVGEQPFTRCVEGLAGNYDVAFKADVSSSRSDVIFEITASEDDNCYTGKVVAPSDMSELGTVESWVEKDGILTLTVPDFTIPPGASPILPDGGVAHLEMRSTSWVTEGACGELTFKLQDPAIESEGDFAMVHQDSTEFSIVDSDTEARCQAIERMTGCGLDAYPSEDWQLKWITDTQKDSGDPAAEVGMELEANPLTCLSGRWYSLEDDRTLAYARKAEARMDGNLRIFLRYFQIPPNPNISFLNDGGLADLEMTSTENSADTFCGNMSVNLFDPIPVESPGTFVAEKGALPADFECAQ